MVCWHHLYIETTNLFSDINVHVHVDVKLIPTLIIHEHSYVVILVWNFAFLVVATLLCSYRQV